MKKQKNNTLTLNGDTVIKGDMFWEDLQTTYNEISMKLVSYLATMDALVKETPDMNYNFHVSNTVSGFIKSIGFLTTDLNKTLARHTDEGVSRVGAITKIDDKMDYLDIAQRYVAIEETTTAMYSIVFLDTMLTTAVNTLDKDNV